MTGHVVSRRAALRSGFGAVGIGLLRSAGLLGSGIAGALATRTTLGRGGSAVGDALLGEPILDIPADEPSLVVKGMRVARWWSGDDFQFDTIPFHSCENCFPEGVPPAPTEEVEVAIVGGGLSGLCSAYLLRDRQVALFELRDRVGGNTMGERWNGVPYSLGGAYFITPDAGTFLDTLYQELGFEPDVTVDKGSFEVELHGRIVDDFLAARGLPPDQQALFARYAEVVQYYANEAYPEIPLPEGRRNDWILELDTITLKADLEAKVGAPLPSLLAAAIQAYCYSSFGAGWDEISAASGWNFLAAEEFGRWVLPGGNAGLATAFRQALGSVEAASGARIVRPHCRVVDVRLADNDRVQVTWRGADGVLRSLLARHAVMANSKHIAKYMLPDLLALDPDKLDAMNGVPTAAYVVANVLLNRPSPVPFYDIFLLGDGRFPMSPIEAEAHSAVADVLNGEFSGGNAAPTTVLTLYWPLPWPSARFTIAEQPSLLDYAQRLVPQVRRILGVLGIPEQAVHQLRLTRWGHAMPIAKPNAIASGQVDLLRRPLSERIWFVNQDNWLLPAVENSLLEAQKWTSEIRRRLA